MRFGFVVSGCIPLIRNKSSSRKFLVDELRARPIALEPSAVIIYRSCVPSSWATGRNSPLDVRCEISSLHPRKIGPPIIPGKIRRARRFQTRTRWHVLWPTGSMAVLRAAPMRMASIQKCLIRARGVGQLRTCLPLLVSVGCTRYRHPKPPI